MKKILSLSLIIWGLLCGFVLEAHRNQCGAIVSSDFLEALLTSFRVIFKTELGEFDKSDGQYGRICTPFTSVTDAENYNWMGSVPVMSEWTDVRKLYGLAQYGDYKLTNKHYEATLEVDRDTLEDDKYGMIAPRIKGLARRAIRFYNEKVFSQLDDGETLLAYDGTAFFDASRTIGSSGTVNNIISGSVSGNEAQIRTGLQWAIERMRMFKDDRGKPMNLVPDLIVCAPATELMIRQALKPGIPGVERAEASYFKQENIIASPWIDNATNDWFVLCTKAEVNPIILQLRKPPEFVALDDPKSEHVFKNRTFLYGIDDRFEVGYADPRTAIKIHDA